MSNPFSTASAAAPEAPAAVVDPVVAAAASTADAPKKTKTGKDRKERNRTITESDKKHILASYATTATGDIAKELGLTRAQVYNTVRNTRKELQKHLDNPEVSAEAKARIQQALDKLPAKEFSGGAASGAGRKNASLDDILSSFGI